MENFIFDPEIKVDFLTFSDGAEHVQVDPDSLYTSMDIIARLDSSQNIVRFFLLLEAINQVQEDDGHVCNLTISMPYVPYARQDRHCAPGQSFALKVFMNQLSSAVYNCNNLNIIFDVYDVHSPVVLELADTYSLTFNHHTQLDEINQVEEVRRFVESCDIMVAPDKGALRKSVEIATAFSMECLQSDKVRDPVTGYISETIVAIPYQSFLKNKVILVCDDICDGGMTFNLLAEELKKNEPAAIKLLITHGIVSKGVETLRENFDSLMVLNCMNDDLEEDEFLTIVG